MLCKFSSHWLVDALACSSFIVSTRPDCSAQERLSPRPLSISRTPPPSEPRIGPDHSRADARERGARLSLFLTIRVWRGGLPIGGGFKGMPPSATMG